MAATLPDLIRILVEHRVGSKSALDQYARYLREAGRIGDVRHGPGGTLVSYQDAARLLLAIAATERPRAAVERGKEVGAYVWQHEMAGEREWLREIDEPTLEDGLATMLSALGAGEVHRYNELLRREENAERNPDLADHLPIWPPVVRFTLFRGNSALLKICEYEARYIHATLLEYQRADISAAEEIYQAFERETAHEFRGKQVAVTFEEPVLTAIARALHTRYPT